MKNRLKTFLSKYFGQSLELRIRLFNVLVSVSGCFCVIIATVSVFSDAGFMGMAISLAAAVFCIALLIFATAGGHARLCHIIFIAGAFFILFPVLFFSMGGYHGGIPTFFVFAVVFTVFMLEGRTALIVTSLEITLYVGLYIFAYINPDSVSLFSTEMGVLTSNIQDLIIVSVALGATMYAQVSLYREQQRKIDAQNAALQELNLMKTEFLGNMSHELKTPLTCVSVLGKHSYGVMTEDWPLDDSGLDEMRDNLRIIVVESDRMKRIVDELLNVAVIEQGKFILSKEDFPLPELAEELHGVHFKAINTNGNTLEFDFAPDLPHVFADRSRLREVLINLLSNAARHTKGGAIRIIARPEGGHIALSVADNGEGIPEELRESLFTKFLGAETGRAHGTGLGLYICKQIVKAHGGEIRIESEPGAGTAVHFTLPLGEVE